MKKHIAANEKNYLQKATMEFEQAVEEFRKTSSAEYIVELEKKVKGLEKQIFGMNGIYRYLQKIGIVYNSLYI